MKKNLLAFALVLPLLATFYTGAYAADRAWLPYNELLQHTYLDKFYSVPTNQRDHVRMRAMLVPHNKAFKSSDVVLTIAADGGAEVIHIDPDGSFDLPDNPQWVKQNPMVLTSLPAGEKSAIGFNAFAVLPAENHVSYAALMAGVAQANQLVHRFAGVLRLFAPKFDGVEIHFAKPAQQTIQILTKAGPQLLTAGTKGAIKLKLDDDLLREDPQLVFSEHAAFADLTTK